MQPTYEKLSPTRFRETVPQAPVVREYTIADLKEALSRKEGQRAHLVGETDRLTSEIAEIHAKLAKAAELEVLEHEPKAAPETPAVE